MKSLKPLALTLAGGLAVTLAASPAVAETALSAKKLQHGYAMSSENHSHTVASNARDSDHQAVNHEEDAQKSQDAKEHHPLYTEPSKHKDANCSDGKCGAGRCG